MILLESNNFTPFQNKLWDRNKNVFLCCFYLTTFQDCLREIFVVYDMKKIILKQNKKMWNPKFFFLLENMFSDYQQTTTKVTQMHIHSHKIYFLCFISQCRSIRIPLPLDWNGEVVLPKFCWNKFFFHRRKNRFLADKTVLLSCADIWHLRVWFKPKLS